jgi:hypothetical protein
MEEENNCIHKPNKYKIHFDSGDLDLDLGLCISGDLDRDLGLCLSRDPDWDLDRDLDLDWALHGEGDLESLKIWNISS